jgi:hypothetical protein
MTQDLSVPPTGGNMLSLFSGSDDDYKDMRKKDHLLPRANILQALSQDVVDGRYPAGTVIDSSTKGEIIKPKTEGKFIVPLMMWLEWIEWNRMRNVDKDKRIIERSVDPQSKLALRADKWETYKNNEGRDVCAVTEYYNFIVAIIDPKHNNYDDVYLTGFARSSHKIGKMWLNRMYKTKIEVEGVYTRPPMWAMRWAYKTEMEKKNGFSYYVPVIGDGQANPQSDWARLKAISEEFKARRTEIMERNSNKDEAGDDAVEVAAAGNAAAEM